MQHLAIIPDGNRRWAAKNKLKAFLGHKKGLEALELAIKFSIEKSIKYLSFYTFSLENFNRTESEKKYLFDLFLEEFPKKVPNLIKNGVKVKFIGNKTFFPKKLTPLIKKIEKDTEHLNKLTLILLFCYGSRNELVYTIKDLIKKVENKEVNIEDINEQVISNNLWTKDIPDPDLIIRTSNCVRLSNFLLYQSAYSELMFLECLWPDITEKDLNNCLEQYKQIKRNFGS